MRTSEAILHDLGTIWSLIEELFTSEKAPTTIKINEGEFAQPATTALQIALKVSYKRSFISRLCNKLMDTKGAMIAIGLDEHNVLKCIDALPAGTLSVACVNSHNSCKVSGDADSVEELRLVSNVRSTVTDYLYFVRAFFP